MKYNHLSSKLVEPSGYRQQREHTNLAELYRTQGQYEQAEPLYQRALTILEKQFGPDHPNTEIVRGNYTELLKNSKRKRKGHLS